MEIFWENVKWTHTENNQRSINENVQITSAGWKTWDTQNNSLTIDLSEDEDLDR